MSRISPPLFLTFLSSASHANFAPAPDFGFFGGIVWLDFEQFSTLNFF